MQKKEGKVLYSEIMKVARKLSAEAGSPRSLVPGSLLQAARMRHDADAPKQPYEEWWSEVHFHGQSPVNEQDPPANVVLRARIATRTNGSIQGKYLDFVWTENIVPSDAYFCKLWNCKDRTLSHIRSRLKKFGFEFRSEHGGYIVMRRPPIKPSEFPAHKAKSESVISVANTELPQLALVDEPRHEEPIAAMIQDDEPPSTDLPAGLKQSWVEDRKVYVVHMDQLVVYHGAICEQLEKLFSAMGELIAVQKLRLAAEERMAEAWSTK